MSRWSLGIDVGHDPSVAEFFCHDILVMLLGRQMEYGTAKRVFNAPHSDYAKQLIASAPRIL